MASLLTPECGIPNIILVGVPHINALNRVLAKLKQNRIIHYAWSEPDYDFGFTAIATEPLTSERKMALSNYRLWKYGGGPAQAACGSNPDSATTLPDTSNGVCLQ